MIDDELVTRLTPAITALRIGAPQPVTVYIDRLGGSTYYADALLRLLRAPTQEDHRCPLTTVVTTVAASAGADLLAAGDYAIAFSGATIHYHGTRRSAEAITIEKAAQLAGDLHHANERFALRLAKRVVARLLFVFSAHRPRPQNTANDASASPGAASPVEVLVQIIVKALDPTLAPTVQEALKL
ncbi:MAG: ATP-dependent Clp protease proteolytic subunit [Verrucomicrobia bacterium]|nr:ATP-dependent Clp protease proteolytic subunit [Verrucomicrobiota bacterium]